MAVLIWFFLSFFVSGAYVFIDGIARITNSDVNSLESVFASVAKLTDITFVITVSAGENELPEFLKKYI